MIILKNLNNLEKDEANQNIDRVLQAYSFSLSEFAKVTADWSSWDDTYSFINDGNSKYIGSNLTDSTFTNSRINIMLFINSSDEIVFSKGYDLQNNQEITVPQSINSYLSKDMLLSAGETGAQITGLLLLPDSEPLLVVASPIITSDDQGPSRGTLIFGRFLSAAEITRLSDLTSLNLSFYSVNDQSLPEDVKQIYPSLKNNLVATQEIDKQHLAGYTLMNDVNNNPALILRVDMPRYIVQERENSINYLLLVMAVIVAVFGEIAFRFVNKYELIRLKKLATAVEKIGTSGNISERVTEKGNDEISVVANNINNMLTALQRSEGKILESEQYYRSIFETTGAAMAIVTENNLLSLVNSEFEKLSGYSKFDLENQKRWTEFIKLPDSKNEIELHREAAQKSNVIRNLESSFSNRNGDLRNILLNIDLIPGTKMYVVSIIDITERKQAETAIARLFIEESTLRQKLEVEMKGRVDFTRALVHELKTPLTPMLTSSDMLATELKNGPLLKLAQNINRGANRLNKRIDELLDLAKGEIGMLKLNYNLVHPANVLHEAAEEIMPSANKKHQSLDVEIPPSMDSLWADETRLLQIITNLLNNAYKFTPENGKIILKAWEANGFLTVEVQDNGPGISGDDQQKIFNTYYQGGSVKQQAHGLGIGLALCKLLTELHGGKIWVESQIGAGSTFGFSIPLKQQPVNQN
ncbi:MAG TPA: CHASE4 domain-containing protein [Dehalococcoidales bacterium]|nr:CHASE4 domain-containing protein [Dehalococcoidales bacterium]